MILLGIESSCDETSAALVEKKGDTLRLLSQTTATSLSLHAKTGGIIPEVAAREQIKFILPVIKETIEKGLHKEFNLETLSLLDGIAVTYGPGLIGSLLVGIETARTISALTNIPLIPVNHLHGHVFANWLTTDTYTPPLIEFPCIVLVVSGGHTDLLLMKNQTSFTLLGATRDDAAGEAFDKIGRLLGLEYPAGPIIEQRAKEATSSLFFPRPLIDSNDYDFSFSGLKTAVLREVKEKELTKEYIDMICASVMKSISAVLVKKTLNAASEYNAKTIIISGGVAANQTLRDDFQKEIEKEQLDITFLAPPRSLCTDNGGMIAAAGFMIGKPVSMENVIVDPQAYFE